MMQQGQACSRAERRGPIHRVLALASGLLVPAAVAVLFLYPLQLPFDGRLMKSLETAAHFPLFFIGVWAALRRFPLRLTFPSVRMALAMLTLLAVALELLQALTHRDPNLIDALFSSAGAWAAVLAHASMRSIRRGWIVAARAGVMLMAIAAVIPSSLVLADRAYAQASFPLLASFEGRSEPGRWWGHGCRLSRVAAQNTHGDHALRVAVEKPRTMYPGLFMTDGVLDWTGYSRLCLDLYLTGGSERGFWIRADDRPDYPSYADRAQVLVMLVPGANAICLELDSLLRTPDGRPLDRARLSRWGMFFDAPQGGESVFIDNVRLAR